MTIEGVSALSARARTALPRGRSLPDALWARRHAAIVLLLWAHVLGLWMIASLRGYELLHTTLEVAIIAACALVAGWRRLNRRARASVATFGLFTSSALLVHFSGGFIEMHFHFFVMVAVVTLYQDWLPFLVGIGYVLVHHGVFGTLSPEHVYNHESALENPWGWAALHAAFIVAESVACIVAWKKAEEYATELSDQGVRRREALELNDLVVQGLVVAKASFELGDEDGGKRALDATLGRARGLVSDLLGDEPGVLERPGSLVREGPATVRRS